MSKMYHFIINDKTNGHQEQSPLSSMTLVNVIVFVTLLLFYFLFDMILTLTGVYYFRKQICFVFFTFDKLLIEIDNVLQQIQQNTLVLFFLDSRNAVRRYNEKFMI